MISRRNLFSALIAGFLVLLVWFPTPSAEAIGGKLPPIGVLAPTFTLPTNTGDGTISLADYRGKWLVVYFYPADFTSGCTLEARRFQSDLPKYQAKNTEILGISADSVDYNKEFCTGGIGKFLCYNDLKGLKPFKAVL